MNKKFRFDNASVSDTRIGRESLPKTDMRIKLDNLLRETLGDFELKKQLREKLREELKNSFNNKGIFEDTENIKRIKDELHIKASDYQKLKGEIVNEVNEVNKKTSASLHNKKFTKKEIETIIKSLHSKIQEKKEELARLPYFDQHSKRANTSKIINTFETSIKELQNYMRRDDFKPKTLEEIKGSIPKYKNFIFDGETTARNRRHKTLKNVVASLTPHTKSTGGTRRSKMHRSKMHRSKTHRNKTHRNKTHRNKTRKKSKKSITK